MWERQQVGKTPPAESSAPPAVGGLEAPAPAGVSEAKPKEALLPGGGEAEGGGAPKLPAGPEVMSPVRVRPGTFLAHVHYRWLQLGRETDT